MKRLIGHASDRLFRSYDPECSSLVLALFRVCYGLVLFCEVVHLIRYRQLIFDVVPFVERGLLDFFPALLLWLIIIFCLIVGLFTRFVVVANYALSLVFFDTSSMYEYHVDSAYLLINFLLIFAPVSRRLSLDGLFRTLAGREPSTLSSGTWANANRLILVFSGIGLLYFDSVFHKFGSQLWLDGLGVWLPASLPFVTWTDLSPVLNVKPFMLFLGYLTLALETTFIFAMWFQPARPFLFVIGLGLHIGILIAFPIPWFALAMCGLYILLIPDAWLRSVRAAIRKNEPVVRVTFNPHDPVQRFQAAFVSHFDVRGACKFEPNSRQSGAACLVGSVEHTGNDVFRVCCRSIAILWPLSWLVNRRLFQSAVRLAAGVWHSTNLDLDREEKLLTDQARKQPLQVLAVLLLLTMALFQASSTISKFGNHWSAKKIAKRCYLNPVREVVVDSATTVSHVTRRFFGTNTHGVFLNPHFDGYDKIIAIRYLGDDASNIWLPIIRPSGQPGTYQTGRIWARWTWRVNGPAPTRENLRRGIRDFTAFWAVENGKGLEHGVFEILVKQIDVPHAWERDFLTDQMAKEWKSVGLANWHEQQFSWDESIWEAMKQTP
jgi:hypothetical protein